MNLWLVKKNTKLADSYLDYICYINVDFQIRKDKFGLIWIRHTCTREWITIVDVGLELIMHLTVFINYL